MTPPETAETPLTGLTAGDVAARVGRGQTNASGERSSRTLGEILRANIFTRFNFILGTLLVAILAVGQIQDALFGIVLISNSLIGIVQEVRAKRTLDQLAVLNAPRARVIRDNVTTDVAVEQVVLDDIVDVHTGDQIVTDGTVRTSAGMQVDESLLTGESEPVEKSAGGQVLSGSFVVSGSGRYQATAVGADAYARKLAAEARRFKLAHSELIAGISRILTYITWAIPPIAALLVFSQLHAGGTWRDAVTGTVAGLVGMVPQGLVLLTSIAFGVAAVTLARRKVLVQQLPAVEGLARVDIVCFDKTGTLTDGTIAFDRVERLDDAAPVEAALAALADDENRNTTLAAVAEAFPTPVDWVRSQSVPFSSARKWSAANFGTNGTWVLGAPEMVLSSDRSRELGRAGDLAATGERVLVLARSDAQLDGEKLPPVRAVAFVLFAEQVRADAAETIAYFAQQGVAMKVISGDSPRTVSAVAARVGLPHADEPVDARELPDDADSLGAIVEERSVFGRVTPRQKQSMVTSLQARGHTVAMTGDGVNDALALKLADIGIAMGSGASATKSVAQLVLLDGRFASMPGVVAEGRRVTANIERVANVFITKTVWATLLALAVGIALWPYPFLPRDLTIIDTLTIGIPSFFLALAPNLRRYVPGFVGRVLRFTVPAGVVVAAATFAAFWLARSRDLPLVQQRTGATLVALMLSLAVLVILALPLTWRRAVLVCLMIVSFVLLFPFAAVRRFYALELPTDVLGATMLIGVAGIAVLIWTAVLLRRRGHGPAAAGQLSRRGDPDVRTG
ncbi:MAG TPA: HAD-IC family P-type ATPase [Candidatus Acidoferrales bacterium]|nr:HAD-IC family P-type ATPase [Candidatus Acidoferrales bacterium]